MSVDRVCGVFFAGVDRRIFFTLRQKRIRGGSTYAERNSGPLNRYRPQVRTPPLSQCHAWLGARQ